MNVQTFASTLQFLTDLDGSLELQPRLDAVGTSLDNLVQSPAHPTHQSSLAAAMTAFSASAAKLSEKISPAMRALVNELGGGKFFDPGMAEEVRIMIANNAMTPSVARDYVKKFASDRNTFLQKVRSTLEGIRGLGIEGEALPAGSAELAFLVPRQIFDNELGTFAKELAFFNRLIKNVSEALAGEPEPIQLRQISSSVPTITVAAALTAMAAIGTMVNKFLDAWKKVEEIREIRQKLSKIGMKKKATITELTEEIVETVNEVVEESTSEIIAKSQVESGRKNELEGFIKRDMLKLFGQLERGLVVEIRVNPAATKSDEANEDINTLRTLSSILQFPAMNSDPVLLTSIGDGDFDVDLDTSSSTLKTTKHRTSTKKTSTLAKDDQDDEHS